METYFLNFLIIQDNLEIFIINLGLITTKPIYPQNDIKVWQVKLNQVSKKYGSTNKNKDMFIIDRAVNYRVIR